jgi:hypothetical protein
LAWIIPAAMVAGTVISAASSWLSSKAAEMASDAERQAIMDAAKIIEQNVSLPEFDQTPLSFEQYKLLQQYVPEVAKYTEETQPKVVREAQSQGEIGAQKQALRRMQELSVTGEDVAAKAQQQSALDASANAQASERANILREMARRGVGGSSTDALTLMQAGENEAQAARQASLQAQGAAADRRLQALSGMANLATSVRGQNTATEKTNVDIINDFNQRSAMRKQAYDQYRAGVRNEAQKFNAAQAQENADRNVALRNQQQAANRQRQDTLRQQEYDNKMGYYSKLAGYKSGSADVAGAEAQAKLASGTSALGSALFKAPETLSNWKRYEKLSEDDKEPK